MTGLTARLTDPRTVRLALMGALFAIVGSTLAALATITVNTFTDELRPLVQRKAETVGRIMAAQIERAVEAGVPIAELAGLDAFVMQHLVDHPEIHGVVLRDIGGVDVYRRTYDTATSEHGDDDHLTFPIAPGGELRGTLMVDVDHGFVQQALDDLLYEVLSIFGVALLLTVEIVAAILLIHVVEPMRQFQTLVRQAREGQFTHFAVQSARDELGRAVAGLNRMINRFHARFAVVAEAATAAGQALPDQARGRLDALAARLGTPGQGPQRLLLLDPTDVRLPLFIFFFATELSRPFLPLFAGDLPQDVPWVSQGIAIALPMTSYVLVSALLTPVAGAWTDRYGPKTLFLAGLVPTALSLVGQGLADTLTALILWRAVEGIGFALVSIAALGYIQTVTTEDNRARGSVTYTAAFVTAGICGTLIGGILADRIGYGPTILLGAGLAGVAALIVHSEMERVAPPGHKGGPLKVVDFARVFANLPFVSCALGLSFGAQFLAAGYLYYMVPLMMADAGLSLSAIGRVMMLAFLTNIVVSRLAAPVADRRHSHGTFAAGGLVIAGGAATIPMLWPDFWGITASVILVGIGQAISTPSRGALMLRDCGCIDGVLPSSAVSMFRLVERCGAVAGPVAAAALVGWVGYDGAAGIIGGMVTAGAVIYAIITPSGPATAGHRA